MNPKRCIISFSEGIFLKDAIPVLYSTAQVMKNEFEVYGVFNGISLQIDTSLTLENLYRQYLSKLSIQQL